MAKSSLFPPKPHQGRVTESYAQKQGTPRYTSLSDFQEYMRTAEESENTALKGWLVSEFPRQFVRLDKRPKAHLHQTFPISYNKMITMGEKNNRSSIKIQVH